MVIETLGVSVVKTNNQWPRRKTLVMDPCTFEHFMPDTGGITDQRRKMNKLTTDAKIVCVFFLI